MRYTLPLLFAIAIITTHPIDISAVNLAQVKFHNEQTDTTKITDILIDVEAMSIESPQKIVAEVGRRFLDTPYVAGTLEGTPEMLTVNTSELDCTTFIETAVAMAITIKSHRTSWRDYIYNLEQIRYRGGEIDGYHSRLHYISDWIVDNTHRGNLQEATDRITRADFQVKTLDFMTRNRDKYPALKDSATYEKMKSAEIGYRSHRYPYIKTANVRNLTLLEGDIVAITTSTPGLDVTHMGIIILVNGKPHLMHASSKEKKVVIDKLPLVDYLRRSKANTGIRIIRLTN